MIKKEITITLVQLADGGFQYKGKPQITEYWHPSDYARKLLKDIQDIETARKALPGMEDLTAGEETQDEVE